MNLARKIFVVVHIAFFIAAGVALILAARGVFFADFLRALPGYLVPERVFLAGFIALLLGLIPALLKVVEVRRGRYVAFENPDGEVAIALHTIEDFVRRVGQAFPEVLKARPIIVPRPGAGVEIVLETVLEEGANIPELTEAIQHRIKTQLQELLGIENIAGVQITVVKIKPGPASAVPRAPAPPPPEETAPPPL
jgi:uncharacterized alkaline shock family protein YloU